MSKSSVAKNTGFRTYTKVSDEDWDWFVKQKPSVQQLWGECMRAERFGEKFYELETRLSENSFYEAKKVLEGQRFEFQPIQKLTKNGRFKIKGWKVRNLHGSNIHEYWNSANSLVPQNLGEESQTDTVTDEKSSTTDFTVNYRKDQGVLPQNLGEEKPVAFDTTAFDSSLLSSYNLLLSNEKDKESSCSSRSGRLSLDPFTKVTGSSSSPDAQPTQGKELTPTFNKKDSEEAKPANSNSSVFCEHGLKDFVEDQEDKVPVQKMMDRCSELDRRPLHAETPQSDVPKPNCPETSPEAPATLPDPWDTQSDVPPTERTVETQPDPIPVPYDSIYIDVERKLSEAGLLSGKGREYLSRFESELKAGRLYPIAEGFIRNGREVPCCLNEGLIADYLLRDLDDEKELWVCLDQGRDHLILTTWSTL